MGSAVSWLRVLTIISVVCVCSAQRVHYRFQRLSVNEGLSQSDIYAMAQDNDGFLWFGSQDGLNLHDGVSFKIFRSDPDVVGTLTNDFVNALMIDTEGMLWVGTRNGLFRFDQASQTFAEVSAFVDGHLGDSLITALELDWRGRLWIGSERGGLHVIESHQLKQVPLPSSEAHILSLLGDLDGTMWVGTQSGVVAIDAANYEPKGSWLEGTPVHALKRDATRVLWLGTRRGLYRQSDHEFEWFPPISNHVWCLLEDSDHKLWVGTESGLWVLNSDRTNYDLLTHNPHNQSSLGNADVRAMMQDRTGVIWIATRGTGINKLAQPTPWFRHYVADVNQKQNLNDSLVWEIFESRDGLVWIGTKTGGLNVVDPKTDHFTHYQHDPNNPASIGSDWVFAVEEDRLGFIWVGTSGGGLNRLNRATGTFDRWIHVPDDPNSLPNDRVFALLEDRYGQLWVGTNNGLARMDENRRSMQVFLPDPNDSNAIKHNQIRSLYEDHKGDIWVGTTRGGVSVLSAEGRPTRHFQHHENDPNSLANDWVLCVLEDSSGRVWIGTDGGLNRLETSGSMRRYRVKDGLPNEVIYGLLEDERGLIWITTNHGLSRLNPNDDSFRNLDVQDGLLSNEFNQGSYHKAANGDLLVGGIGGITRFTPHLVTLDHRPPQVALTNLLISNKPVPISTADHPTPLSKHIQSMDAITLSYRETMFAIEFAALHYTAPERNRYAYRMAGVHQDWIEGDAKHRVATFTRLSQGSYDFQVKAANKDGIWSEPISLRVKILPPPWQTWWAYLTYAAVLLLASALFIRFRLQKEAERRAFQKSLATREERLRLALGGSGDELWDWNLQTGEVARINPLKGIHRPSKLDGPKDAPSDTRVHPEDSHILLNALQAHLSGQAEDFEAVYRIQADSGEWLWLRAHGQIVERDGSGQATRVAGTTTDITANKCAEEELRRLNEELEERVEKRTSDLRDAQSRLIDVAHRAGMAEVAAGVLHNIGNILNSVNISTEVLYERLNSSKVHDLIRIEGLLASHRQNLAQFFTEHPKGKLIPEYLDTLLPGLKTEHGRLTQEVEELREAIRMMTDVIHTQQSYATAGLYTENTDVTEIVDDALKLMQTSLHKRGIQVIRQFQANPKGNVPRVKLVHVLTNIIKNARDAMADVEHPQLTIRVSQPSKDQAAIAVRDNGCGIESDHLKRIFVHGFTTKRDGHGFGLHTCANALTEMGGSLEAYSDGQGKGSTFTLLFPLDVPLTEPTTH
ncbi:MAG: PAS domain-containing protein [Acidobacteria bacterium]|nr:PAS domain-containing protein [Acidobacteriota bacterium]